MIFQEPMTSLNPYHRVGDQIVESILLHEKQVKSAAILEAKNLMNLVEIPEADRRFSSYPHDPAYEFKTIALENNKAFHQKEGHDPERLVVTSSRNDKGELKQSGYTVDSIQLINATAPYRTAKIP